MSRSSAGCQRALVVVDAQQEYARGPLKVCYPTLEDSLTRVEQALTAEAAAGIPVVLVQHHGRPGGVVFDPQHEGVRLLPRVEALVRPGWRRVVKHYASVYEGTGLAQCSRSGAWTR
ncbi:isochorismatase family protein [Actinomyces wuliandei]|uniref:isochorismatase family protein n=1 Tax=Actinomyces wuliandei TaxID=2057743 RepID=UPI001FA98A3C|nr:isochorismatase family protein [Actinomyces wuliandei]